MYIYRHILKISLTDLIINTKSEGECRRKSCSQSTSGICSGVPGHVQRKKVLFISKITLRRDKWKLYTEKKKPSTLFQMQFEKTRSTMLKQWVPIFGQKRWTEKQNFLIQFPNYSLMIFWSSFPPGLKTFFDLFFTKFDLLN